MEAKEPAFKSKKKYIGLIVSLIIVALVVILHIVLVYIVMPYLDNYFVLELPGRSGGPRADAYFNTEEATIMGLYAIAIACAVSFFIALLTLAKKYSAALGFTLIFTLIALLYILTIIGNIFWNAWGGWWAILGYAIGVVIGMVPLYLLLWNIEINDRPNSKKKRQQKK